MFTRTFYIRIEANRLQVNSPGVDKGYDDTATVAIRTEPDGRKIVAAIGREADALPKAATVELIRPFAHPRILVGDFTVAEKLLQHALRSLIKTQPWSFNRPMVRVIIHPKRDLAGGLTQVEYRTLNELAFSCGARKVAIHEGPDLTEREVSQYSPIKAFSPRRY